MKFLFVMFISISCFGEPTIEEMMGPDKDGNGVRDDIDRYIDKEIKHKDQNKSFKQYAKYLRLGFKYYEDKEKSIKNTKARLTSFECVSGIWKRRFPGWKESQKYSEVLDEVELMMYNSRSSLKVKNMISRDFSGQVTGFAKSYKSTCEFKFEGK